MLNSVKSKFRSSMIRIIIADDHRLVREAWHALLSRNERIQVLEVCDNGMSVVECCQTLDPDVVLMDVNMQPFSGIDATKAIRSFSQKIKIVGISLHTGKAYVDSMLEAGANGYVTKSSPADEVIDAIVAVHQGRNFFCNEIAEYFKQN